MNAFPQRKLNIVPRFGFHSGQNRINIRLQIEINGIGRKNVGMRFLKIPVGRIEVES
ncbi:hypothetical protein SDC9_201508 [bioreactor metagenome]|uniref:Uncharacterized protein n=1 Tax=bioreactor metagenome TaxID=1076179 RepID=A0A645ISC9_9ZZZZ